MDNYNNPRITPMFTPHSPLSTSKLSGVGALFSGGAPGMLLGEVPCCPMENREGKMTASDSGLGLGFRVWV